MGHPVRSIRSYMTGSPEVIGPRTSVKAARHLCEAHGVRHLPVVKDNALVGMISEGDLRLVEVLDPLDLDGSRLPVDGIMDRHPLQVPPDAHLDEVVHHMASRKCDSAVVVEEGQVVGIFTTIDAMNAFEALLQDRSSATVR